MTDILQCTPMRAADSNTPPAFALPPGACDAHFHVFEPGYPHVPDPLYTFPDGTLDAYLRMAEVLGIERMILVQPSCYGTDNSLLALLSQGSCWIKLSGPYRVAQDRPLSDVAPLGRALVATRPDRLLWGSDWPHLPDGQRDTGEILNLLADWAPAEAVRSTILVDGPDRLFFSSSS